MSEEKLVAYEVDPLTPQPYNRYIHQRNGNFAAHMADIIGASGVVELNGSGLDNVVYQIPSRTLLADEAAARGIHSVDDFYGGVVPSSIAGTKAALHQVTGKSPDGYSRHVADRLENEGLVLPGATVFNLTDAEAEAARLIAMGYDVRLKDPAESDFGGQEIVNRHEDIGVATGLFRGDVVAENGLVVEVNLHDARTFSAGAVTIDGKEYAFVGEQKTVRHKGREKFGGVSLIFVGRSLDEFALSDDPSIYTGQDDYFTDAVRKAKKARDIYSQYGDELMLSRFSFDIVRGTDHTGTEVSGIVDPTFRAGGLTAGELIAVKLMKERLRRGVTVHGAEVDVELHYEPVADIKLPPHRVLFLNSRDLIISAEVKSYVEGNFF